MNSRQKTIFLILLHKLINEDSVTYCMVKKQLSRKPVYFNEWFNNFF